MEKQNEMTQFEGGSPAPRLPIQKTVVYKSLGMNPVTARTTFTGEAYVLSRTPMNVMCGRCGDVGDTTIVTATLPCWKNWCLNPFPCSICTGCKELKQFEHYCLNCGTCLALCEEYKKVGVFEARMEREFPKEFGI